MGDHLVFLRYYWFDRQIRQNRFPNAPALASHFEINERTARRAIEAMQRDLDAPLAYSHGRKGYHYTDVSYKLPPLWISQEEILAMLVAKNLLSCCAGGLISSAIGSMGRKMMAHAEELGLPAEKLDEAFSAAWLGYSPAQADVFRIAARSLIDSRLLAFSYSSPHTDTISQRLVEPHHLQHYMGTWVLLARCRLCQDWRKFLLARMDSPVSTATPFTPQPRSAWNHHLEGAYGIFQGGKSVPAVIRFAPERASMIKEQVWHPDQRLDQQPDGSLLLTVPVADLREIKLQVLQYGAQAEVLAPAALREEIRREIEKMARVYG